MSAETATEVRGVQCLDVVMISCSCGAHGQAVDRCKYCIEKDGADLGTAAGHVRRKVVEQVRLPLQFSWLRPAVDREGHEQPQHPELKQLLVRWVQYRDITEVHFVLHPGCGLFGNVFPTVEEALQTLRELKEWLQEEMPETPCDLILWWRLEGTVNSLSRHLA